MTDERVVLVTAGSREEAERLAETLVGERLAACVNLVGPIRSIYRWKGEVCRDDEQLLVIKTTRESCAALERRVRELHSYDVPEVLVLPIEGGSEAYLAWLREQVG
jgi:periplasmic divalent cation tolerance protein